MERIDIAGSIRDAWVGDVLELHELTTGFKYAMYMGCEIHTNANVQERLYRMLKLTPSDDQSRYTYYISTQNASPRLDAEAITLVPEDLILSHFPISNDGLSGIRSKRWNPFKVWTVTSAGLSRTVRMLNMNI